VRPKQAKTVSSELQTPAHTTADRLRSGYFNHAVFKTQNAIIKDESTLKMKWAIVGAPFIRLRGDLTGEGSDNGGGTIPISNSPANTLALDMTGLC
jgi:hypothetical protein